MKNRIQFSSWILIILFLGSCVGKDEEPPCPKPEVELGDDIILNEGETLILDAGNNGVQFIWSTGENSSKIEVDTAGVYWVRVTNNCAETNTDTIEITLAYKTIKVESNYGDFRIWLYPQTTLHRNNFVNLTEQQYYNDVIFHIVIDGLVVQGGDPTGTGTGGPDYKIQAEFLNGFQHDYGSIGAARDGDEINSEKESHGSQFFITVNPNGNHDLDGEFTVFGIVFEGMENVQAISQVEVDENYRPIEDVIMNNVSIDYYTSQELEDNFGFEIP
jgi:cyclophilin family peptidyl-prolyl cis-trans isomerase